MLNPSTADAETDDPTIRKCMGFAQKWGFGGITVANLFNWRATDPKELHKTLYPVGRPGDEADSVIQNLTTSCRKIVIAWGAIPRQFEGRARQVMRILRGAPIMALGKTKDGWPRHPLYMPYSTAPIDCKESP